MRVRRVLGSLAVIGALVGVLAGSVPAAAVTPIQGKTTYWVIDRAGIKGLVTATEITGSGLTVAFTLWGLRPGGNYALGGLAPTCASVPSGSVFLRDITANARGFVWDPVTVAGTVSDIRSIRLRDLDAGADVFCVNSSRWGTGPSEAVGVTKIKTTGGVRGLAVIDETSTRRVVMAVGGLRAGIGHTIVVKSVSCVSGGRVLNRYRFAPNGQGRAFLDRAVLEPAGTGSVDLVAGSLRIKRGPTPVSCSVPVNRVS